jgi:hypothetical protein
MRQHPSIRLRLTIRGLLIAVAVIAAVFAGGVWYIRQTPRAQECRRMAMMIHATSAQRWKEYASLAEKGATSYIEFKDGTIVIRTQYFHPAIRPTDPKAADEFDRDRARIVALCRARAAYHEQLKQKWLSAAWHPWESLTPDPPPPFPIEIGSVQDDTL